MQLDVIYVSELLEGSVATLSIFWISYYLHSHFRKSFSGAGSVYRRHTLKGILNASLIWFVVWILRKLALNLYRSYLQETHQSDILISIPVPSGLVSSTSTKSTKSTE